MTSTTFSNSMSTPSKIYIFTDFGHIDLSSGSPLIVRVVVGRQLCQGVLCLQALLPITASNECRFGSHYKYIQAQNPDRQRRWQNPVILMQCGVLYRQLCRRCAQFSLNHRQLDPGNSSLSKHNRRNNFDVMASGHSHSL